MRHHMKVFGFTIDAAARLPVAILKDEENDISMPLWLSSGDAVAIASTMLSKELSSQRCGDEFISALMGRLDVELVDISLDVSPDGAICAAAVINHLDKDVAIAISPSEAVRMSLHYDLSLSVASEAVAAAAVADATTVDGAVGEEESQRLLFFLEQLDPSDMGKYPM